MTDETRPTLARLQITCTEIENGNAIPVYTVDPTTGIALRKEEFVVGHSSDFIVSATNGVWIAASMADHGLSMWQACQRAQTEGVCVVSTSFNAPCAVAYWDFSEDNQCNMMFLKAEGKPRRPFFFDGPDQSASWRIATKDEVKRCFADCPATFADCAGTDESQTA